MASTAPYQCIHCNAPAQALYIQYQQVSNTSPLACSHCGNDELDPYQSFVDEVVLLDLTLLRARVYRHLMFNRGAQDKKLRRKEQRRSLWSVGAVVVGLDAYVRTLTVGPPDSLEPFKLFGLTMLWCLLETVSLYVSICFSAWFVLTFIFRHKGAKEHIPLLPLTLAYSSIPALFLLCISSIIWGKEYTLSPPPAALSSLQEVVVQTTKLEQADVRNLSSTFGGRLLLRIVSLSRSNLQNRVSHFGNVTGWGTNEGLVRKAVGGSSAVVGLSAVLNISRYKGTFILSLAWVLYLIVLHSLDPMLE
ncbi:hypothetical protein T439DRAFT_322823 [Meredithblackwellia eburnea MCA 4105]